MDLITIDFIELYDLRFDTSTSLSGSDARSSSPDYSCIYIILKTNKKDLNGCSLVFTLGKGNSVVESSLYELKNKIEGKTLYYIINNFKKINNDLINDEQMCWIGPDKGAYHMAAGGLINAIWDLWAKYEKKPLWKLISDMDTMHLVNILDFHYLEPVLNKKEALKILNENFDTRKDRELNLKEYGLEAYTTSIGWSGYSDSDVKDKCVESLKNGFKNFKMKVGVDIKRDIERANIIRKLIGWHNRLMIDANGVWDYKTARENINFLKRFNIYWVEEPTHPDDIIAHADLKKEIYPIKVATGEQCPNKIMFKQFMQIGGLSILQTDINRLAGINNGY